MMKLFFTKNKLRLTTAPLYYLTLRRNQRKMINWTTNQLPIMKWNWHLMALDSLKQKWHTVQWVNFSFSAWVILWHTNALRNRRVILTCSFLPPICAKSIAVQLNIHFQRMYWLKLIFGIENVIAAFNNRHLILII